MRRLTLDKGWTLQRLDPGKPVEAAASELPDAIPVPLLPAQVADVLRSADRIDAPFLPGKAAEYGWIADTDWVYSLRFDSPGDGRWHLVCDGLDTIADVHLNGSLVGHHENSFLPFELDLSGLLKPGTTNLLQIRFHSITKWLELVETPADVHDLTPTRLLRKPFHDFTDYLGPKPFFARVGIFDAVYLVDDEQARFEEVSVRSSLNAMLDAGRLRIDCSGLIHGEDAAVTVRLTDPAGAVREENWRLTGTQFDRSLIIDVTDPELWWPKGYGEQRLYELEVALVVTGTVQDRRTLITGFRRVEMPAPLHFVVNGRAVRMWGADWAPVDVTTRCWDPDRARSLLELAALGNMNTLRVWAEGAPVPEDFYQVADRMGFMIWQDFHQIPMSTDDAFRAAGRAEAAYTIKRLRHHPSIFLWCGGNENGMWHDFKQPGTPHPQRVILEDDLREVCDQLDPGRVYIPDSPYFGLDANDPRSWDTHGYTSVWFVPGYDYLNFASEDTRISAPMLRSCRRFMRPEELQLSEYSTAHLSGTRYPWPADWTQYTASEGWRKVGAVERFYDATSADGVIHRLGAAASEYYRDVVERQRRGRPSGGGGGERRCGGYLAWKFNDSWPEIYSAKVDYFGEPYMSFYALRRAFAPVLVSFDVADFIHVWVVNDTAVPIAGNLEVRLVHLHSNEVRAAAVYPIRVEPDQSLDVADLTGVFGTFRRDHVLVAELRDDRGEVLAATSSLTDIERNLALPDPQLAVAVDGRTLVISTDSFARSVCLDGDADGDEFGWMFEDNYFDLAPGQVKTVRVHGAHARGVIRVRPYYSSKTVTIDYAPASRS